MSVTISNEDAKNYTSTFNTRFIVRRRRNKIDNSWQGLLFNVFAAIIFFVAAFFLNIMKWAFVLIGTLLLVPVIVRLYKLMKEKKDQTN
jgi:Flp pilus assembly protein TadB